MRKTLVVSYLPRGQRSHTKDLLDYFRGQVKNSVVEELNLLEDVPDLFTSESLDAYVNRNYFGKELNQTQKKSLAKMDRMTAQLVATDVLVLAFPMHNFSFPASVKAWFDSVMLKGETWDMGEKGFAGKLQGKKAIVLMASGGVYEGDLASYDHATTLAKTELAFMGIEDVEVMTVSGTNMFPDKLDQIKQEAEKKVKNIIEDTYS